jgi:hypothetical protein
MRRGHTTGSTCPRSISARLPVIPPPLASHQYRDCVLCVLMEEWWHHIAILSPSSLSHTHTPSHVQVSDATGRWPQRGRPVSTYATGSAATLPASAVWRGVRLASCNTKLPPSSVSSFLPSHHPHSLQNTSRHIVMEVVVCVRARACMCVCACVRECCPSRSFVCGAVSRRKGS